MDASVQPGQHHTSAARARAPTPGAEPSHRTAEQACRECRRRKSKCDRAIPICRLCSKYNRQCTYEKPARTPLTRTHLSRVENELARTKALLRRFMPDAAALEDSHGLEDSRDEAAGKYANAAESGDGHLPVQPGPALRHDVADGTLPQSGHVGHDARGATLPSPLDSGSHVQQMRMSPHSTMAAVGAEPIMHPASESRSTGTTAFSLETPPSSSNFEWDERASGDNKFVDGMASLTSRSNEGGYLGSASGAALLRLTETRDGDAGDSNGQVHEHECRASIPFVLNTMSQLEPFVDAYFRLYHCSYPIVHEATFRAQFMEIIPRPPGNTWQVLLFVISALGVFTSSTATSTSDVDLALFDAAKERLSIDVLETGNLVLVQALTLISNYLQKRNKPNSGYNYMGLARRVAMGIGLHKEFPTWDASLLTLEMRRRVWYCLYIFDIGAMITFSRPLDFPMEGVDVKLPMNAHDSDITSATRHPPPPAPETTVYSHLRAQAQFHLATSSIYSKIISHPLPSATELLHLDDTLIGGWLANLPPYFAESAVQPPKFALAHAILRWRYRNFRILMYRPFLVGRVMARSRGVGTQGQEVGTDIDLAIERCLAAAAEAVELICTFWLTQVHHRTMMACWYGLYFLFQAILIPVICLRNDPQSPLAQGWRSQISQAIEVLESMALMNPSARRCLRVITDLCGNYLQSGPGPDIGDGIGVNGDGWRPTEESPQTQLASLYPLMWPTLEMGMGMGVEGDSIIQESTIMDFMNRLPAFE
ncbi:fungal-specific transcription factor domain-containing protein [Aspergillus tetrazonus]